MRCLAISLLLTIPATIQADGSAQALAILNRALRAIGADSRSARLPAATWKVHVTLHGIGDPIVYDGEWAVRPPEKARISMTGTFHGRHFERVLVVNGDQGWIKQDGVIEKMERARLTAEKERLHAAWVASLLPLRAPDFSMVPITKDDSGRKRIGLRVSHAGHRDVTLYFDRAGQLTDSMTRFKNPQSGTDTVETVHYADYRSFDGLKRPTRITIRVNGKVRAEGSVSDYQRHAHLDERAFQAPR
jgi:hypothetical protein